MDDAPKLFLETSLPTSASPYPSPSSAFYPPPIPASHEFANKLATITANKRYRGSGGVPPTSVISPTSGVASPTINGTLSPSSANSSRRGSTSGPSPLSNEAASASSPTTPTPAPAQAVPAVTQASPATDSKPTHDRKPSREKASANLSLGTLPPNTLASSSSNPPPATPTTPAINAGPHTPGTTPSKRTSQIIEVLTPIRAAPPSPAPSRRGSLIRRGSSRRRQSGGPTLMSSSHSFGGESASSSMVSEDGSIAGDVPEVAASKRASRRLSAFTALSALESATEGEVVHFGRSSAGGSVKGESKEDPTPAAQEEEADDTGTAAKPILVQDFGFPEDDVRFSKRPWYLLTQAERSALGEDSRPKEEEEESDEDDEYEHGAGGWSTAWLKHGRAIEDGDDGEDMTPRFGHGFSDEGDANATQGGGENGGNGGGGEIDPDSPLPPGIYRALYAFEAEGTAEMSLAEGQLVRVVGRGGGVGWAVVEREWTPGGSGEEQSERPPPAQVDDAAEGSGSGALGLAGQALVPEGYLEIWRLDDEEW